MDSETTPTLKVALLSNKASVPTRATPQSAGLDLYSGYNYNIRPLGYQQVELDLAVEIPPGYYGRIAPRSGLATNHQVGVGGGVIDADFRGRLSVILFNHSVRYFFPIKQGQRVAQLICEKISIPTLALVDPQSLSQTQRGSQGLGSSGR